MAESLKVPKDKFEAAIRALLNTPPTTMADIPRKREPKVKQKKKRGYRGTRSRIKSPSFGPMWKHSHPA